MKFFGFFFWSLVLGCAIEHANGGVFWRTQNLHLAQGKWTSMEERALKICKFALGKIQLLIWDKIIKSILWTKIDVISFVNCSCVPTTTPYPLSTPTPTTPTTTTPTTPTPSTTTPTTTTPTTTTPTTTTPTTTTPTTTTPTTPTPTTPSTENPPTTPCPCPSDPTPTN